MTERREIINPHDCFTIDYSDPSAAQKAVILLGEGQYGIDGSGGLPLLLIEGTEETWCKTHHGCEFMAWWNSIDRQRVAKAMLSVRLEGERSSVFEMDKHAKKLGLMMQSAEQGG